LPAEREIVDRRESGVEPDEFALMRDALFEVNEETLAVDVIKELGPQGTFFGHPHTLRHLRDVVLPSALLDRSNWAAVVSQEVRGIEGRAKLRAQELMARETVRPLSTEQERAIDEVVTEAWARRRERAQV